MCMQLCKTETMLSTFFVLIQYVLTAHCSNSQYSKLLKMEIMIIPQLDKAVGYDFWALKKKLF